MQSITSFCTFKKKMYLVFVSIINNVNNYHLSVKSRCKCKAYKTSVGNIVLSVTHYSHKFQLAV